MPCALSQWPERPHNLTVSLLQGVLSPLLSDARSPPGSGDYKPALQSGRVTPPDSLPPELVRSSLQAR
ncbi:hypothetical protein NDU88_006389 [Pleurodeles waltl]|uniref:Uncharacterized protein n=1 Tax=Pleurodeles waltl TaxID=8319 RepID=A0AAV7RNP8_PLEWA|nr:hypothetical protein NDU88_006389 [Pleurodeles waltl]